MAVEIASDGQSGNIPSTLTRRMFSTSGVSGLIAMTHRYRSGTVSIA